MAARPFLFVTQGKRSVYFYLPDRLNEFNKKWDDLAIGLRAKTDGVGIAGRNSTSQREPKW